MADALKLFHYKGITHFGNKVKGDIIAANLAEAKEQLYDDAIKITVLREDRGWFTSKATKKINKADVIYFCRQLSTLINAGINISNALEIIQNGYVKVKFQNMIHHMRLRVDAGEPLHIALAEYPKYFNTYICETVNTAEHTGNLGIMLNRLATSLEKTQSAKQKLKKSLTYPIVILGIVVVMTTLMLLFLVPKFAATYKSFGAKLPQATRLLIDISHVFSHYWYLVGGVIVAIVLLIRFQYQRSRPFHKSFDLMLSRLPIFGELVKKTVMLRLASAFATSIRGGVPAAESLYRIAPLTNNLYFSDFVTRVADEVSAGQKIAVAFRMTGVFLPMLSSMIAIGEESGHLADMLEKMANYLEDEIDVATSMLQTAIEPMIIVIIALLVIGVIVPLYLPIFNLGDIL